jgi:hypothetical protein
MMGGGLRDPHRQQLGQQHELVAALVRLAEEAWRADMPETEAALKAAAFTARQELAAQLKTEQQP